MIGRMLDRKNMGSTLHSRACVAAHMIRILLPWRLIGVCATVIALWLATSLTIPTVATVASAIEAWIPVHDGVFARSLTNDNQNRRKTRAI